jgi:DNA-binding IclR family transcriptional regulator
MLDEVRSERAYRLAAAMISFGHAVRVSSPVLNVLGPMMRAESMRRKMNVGLATADRSMMVYLESVRFNPRVALRNVVAGQQVPMELTSLGRAYLAGISEQERARLLASFKRRGLGATQNLLSEVQSSIRSVKRDGYCAVSWQRGVLAVATPIIVKGLPVYALNISTQNVQPTAGLSAEMGAYLLAFAQRCNAALADK